MESGAEESNTEDRGESRLDSAIAYYQALADMLAAAAARIAACEGPVLVVGLGNGRSFDHLRERLPDRRFLAYDLRDRAHPLSRPEAGDLFLESAGSGVEDALSRLGVPAALIHCDFRHALAYDETSFPLVRLAACLSPGGCLTLEWPEAALSRVLLPKLEVANGKAPGLFLLQERARP
jgi:hypothetical protein